MSVWDTYDVEDKIKEVLSEIKYPSNPEHHFGTPFITAYQLAIELDKRYPYIAQQLGYKIGGRGTDEKNSLSQYLAQQLSQRIKSGKISDIEGAFITNSNLKDIIFDYNGEKIPSSLTKSQYDLSMYRLIK
ncbi:hypothetical protein ACFO25_16835 [Paenactinomyces guangxiensis]|uniref:Uncharacterized protein n=1 Tax=Paenactinomyces guangxiensis TaxID=1490290 RepID=A0A7W1WUW3_9BACL|nr:hypothetical protein [Paenactinomyces guangxiensis]MBA4496423.1 hypothetical protein [Paenactinomyces guangxiensis]MBH8593524.1 hypothetical protein [Paenactinomyces guangxiensis]